MFSFFRNFSLGARLVFSFGGAIALLTVLSVFTLFESRAVRSAAEEVSQAQAERLSLAQSWRQNVALNSERALAVMMSRGSETAAQFSEPMKSLTAKISEIRARFAEIDTTPEANAWQEKLTEVRKRYLVKREACLNAQAIAGYPVGVADLQIFKALAAEYYAAGSGLVEYEATRNKALGEAMDRSMQFMQSVTLAISLGGALSALFFGVVMHRQTVPALRAAQASADRIAAGDLSLPIPLGGRDEVGRLMTSLAEMQESLRTLIGGVTVTADNISRASSEVAKGNQDLSARTEQTAANLQQTASSVEQIASTVRQGAESAKQSDRLAHEAADVATKGGAAVTALVDTMDSIKSSSSKISSIIGTIEGIAFQTNILALNAAVEAARAGEQGRGFAVVATEVRNLAQRCAAAAKEIKTLIGVSSEQVEAGSTQAHQAGRTLGEIVASVAKVQGVVADISTAAEEQASGLGEINRAVAQLDQATQQNAALVEQSAAAADSLMEHAASLMQSVRQFKLSA